MPHLSINLTTARALEKRGYVEFVHPNGNVKITRAGHDWIDAQNDDKPMQPMKSIHLRKAGDRMLVRQKISKSGASVITSGVAGLDYAASNEIDVIGKLLDQGLLKSIVKGGTVKYVGEIAY